MSGLTASALAAMVKGSAPGEVFYLHADGLPRLIRALRVLEVVEACTPEQVREGSLYIVDSCANTLPPGVMMLALADVMEEKP